MADRHEITAPMLARIRQYLSDDVGNATNLSRFCGVSNSAISRIRSGETKTVRGDCWSALNRFFGFDIQDEADALDSVPREKVIRALIAADLDAESLKKALTAVMNI